MKGQWRFFIGQDAFEAMNALRPAERRRAQDFFTHLVAYPGQPSDREVRRPNDRTLSLKQVGNLRVSYWIDLVERLVFIVEVKRFTGRET